MMLQPLVLISLLSLAWTAAGWPCTQMLPSQPPPSLVNRVKPSDVAAIAAVGLHPHSTEMTTVLSRLTELLNVFSPNLTSHVSEDLIEDTSELTQRSSLVEEAKQAVLRLRGNQDVDMSEDWKLVLLLVRVDLLSVCQDYQQVASTIIQTANEVNETVQLLHSQLKRTIVSVALWDVSLPSERPCGVDMNEGEVRLWRVLMTRALQVSLEELLVHRRGYEDRDDFTVTLQDVPMFAEAGAVTTSRLVSDSLTVQMWTNLLQPSAGSPDPENDGALQCPSEARPYLRTQGNSPSHRRGKHRPHIIHPSTGTAMTCKDFSPSPSTPKTVHELKPADIRVVAAVGDSLTAGNGIASNQANILDVLTQYRGLSSSVGGDDNLTTVTTLPNILKYFNRNLTGYSVGKGKENTPKAFLNQAVAGAKSNDVLGQVQKLVARMKKDSRIDFKGDWKVITVFIGGNDVCNYCNNALRYSVENYAHHVKASLDYLHKQVPRAVVNLVEPLHITPLREVHQKVFWCPTWLAKRLCPCVILPKPNSKALQKVEEINRGYQKVLHSLVETGRYDTRLDFTVVVQPFFRNIVLPRLPSGQPDRSYFSADCFHLSQKAQTLMARSLWNNMLEPVGNKTFVQDFTTSVALKCPTKASPFIRTYLNTNYTYAGPPPTPGPIPNWGSDFTCPTPPRSNYETTSVHRLRPADVQVVAAVGDSTTAGTGAKAANLMQLNQDFGGVSWSIGGDETLETVTTLPNILRKFNPSVKGFSEGWGSGQRGFNMATPGATSSEIPAQVRALIKAMREHKEVNFEKDWKLVTIFIGGNDLCHYCVDQDNFSPQNFSHHLQLSLDLLYKEVPRVLVNVVEVMEIVKLKSVMRNTLGCSLLQSSSCPCVIIPSENSPEIEEIKQINHKYQVETLRLVSGERYDGKDDFAVVLQPFLHNSFIPHIGEGEADASFFSLDCFHISERAHAEMAVGLWNNMLEPVGRKQAFNNFTHDRAKIHCPSEASPFIFTKVNSQPSPPVPTTPITPFPSSTSDSDIIFEECPDRVPVWVPVVVGVVSLLTGAVIALFVLSCIEERRNQPKRGSVEMLSGTGL